jgi:hypothetical protein
MTQAKTKLTDLSTRNLRNRIVSAENRLWALRKEEARRDKIKTYGTDTPDLIEHEITVTMEFMLSVKAKDAGDAKRIVDEDAWFDWYLTNPANNVSVEDYYTSAEITAVEVTSDEHFWAALERSNTVIH